MGPLASSVSLALSDQYLSSEANFEVAVQFSFWYASDSAGVASGYWHYSLCRVFPVTPFASTPKDPFFDKAITSFPRDIPAGGLVWIRATNDVSIVEANIFANLAGIFAGLWEHAAATTINANDATITTADTDWAGSRYTTSLYTAGASTFRGGAIFHYPNPDLAGTASYWVNAGTYKPQMPNLIIPHQDRVVVAGRELRTFDAVVYPWQDIFTYTAAFDPAGLVAGSRPYRTLFGSENPSGVGILTSLSTDRLLIIKHTGGGYLVLGDLNNPTIQRLPFVESTYNVMSYAADTPFGVVYGSRNGVFVWSGGETSEKLSTQIEGFFWNVAVAGGSKYGGSQGRFAWWHPWVMVPNNFLYDSRTKSWWRLDRTIALPPTGVTDTAGYYNAPFHVYVVNPANGNLHAFPKLLTHNQTVVDYVFDPAVLSTSYSWKSQPLVETRQRLRSFQELTLVAGGRGEQTVAVTLTGFDEAGTPLTPVTENFKWTAADATGRPVVLRHVLHTNFVAMDVQVKIVVTCSTASTPAAKIHSLNIGTVDRMRSRTDR
jgi:hypothetical protein